MITQQHYNQLQKDLQEHNYLDDLEYGYIGEFEDAFKNLSIKENIFIIGDVHGCYDTLQALMNKLPQNAKVVFVGDIIDRGKYSKEVIKFIRDNNYDCVLGNHEILMIDSLYQSQCGKTMEKSGWYRQCGGEDTMKSYNNTLDQTFKDDLQWLNTLPYYLEYKDIKTTDGRYLVVSHSAISDYWKYKDFDNKSDEFKLFIEYMVWSRDKQIYDNKDIYNVFGHTIVSDAIVEKYYANIDTGCVYKEHRKYGNLSCLAFPAMQVITQQNIEGQK